MKSLKRVTSIILSLAFILTSVFFCLTTKVEAFSANVSEVMLDFEDETGIADSTAVTYFGTANGELDGLPNWGFDYTADPENSENTVLHMFNRVYNGYSVMLGNPDCDYTTENAFTLQPSCTYTLKFNYKYEARSGIVAYNSTKTGFTNTLRFELYSGKQTAYSTTYPKKYMGAFGRLDIDGLASKDIINISPKKNYDYNAETNNSVPETYSRKVIAQDTEWLTAEFTFTTAADITNQEHLFVSISAGNSNINGGGWNQTDADQYVGVYFDDISIKCLDNNIKAGEYVYDFKNDGLSCYSDANQTWFSNCNTDVYGLGENGSYIADEGMYFTTTVDFAKDYNAAWRHRVAVRDTDVNLGGDNGFLKIEQNTNYTVIVKYKPVNIEGSYTDFAIALSAPGGNQYDQITYGVSQHMLVMLDWNRHEKAEKEWQYISVDIDGDALSPCGSDNKGAYLYLTASGTAKAPATFLIESVKVCAVSKDSDAVVIKKSVRGKTVDASICKGGEALSAPPKSLGETAYGWYLADGTQVTTAPSTSATVYAKYPTSVYTFDNGMNDIYMPNVTNLGMKLSIVKDPVRSVNNNVLKMTCYQKGGSTNNFVLSQVPGVTADGYKLKAGSQYSISFDVYIGEYNIISGSQCTVGVWLVNKSGISHTGGKDSVNTDFSAENQALIKAESEKGKWVSVSMLYTPNSTKVQSYPYIAISTKYGDRETGVENSAVVYFDNFVISEVSSAENKGGAVVLDALGGKVDKACYMVGSGEQINLPTPQKEGYIFAGWTTSLAMAKGTLANNTTNMNDEIAPKTVVIAEGFKTYYPIWVAKKTEFTFGSEGNITFQNHLTTTEVTESTGYVSKGHSLFDEDGDGYYELKGDQTPRDPSSFKVNVGSYNGTSNVFYKLREGVTYRISMKLKVAELQSGKARVNVGRCIENGFAIVKITGGGLYDYDKFYLAEEVTNGYIDVTCEYLSKGIFDTALNGVATSSGGCTMYKDCLFVSISQGKVYIKSITVEAVSYDGEIVKPAEGGKIVVNYADNTVKVVPNDGYTYKHGSLKMTYKYHFFDSEKYGAYNPEIEEERASITEAVDYKQGLFNWVGVEYGNDVYSFVNRFSTCPDAMFFSVEFVPTSEISTGVVASSIRLEKAGDQYQSAGIRFRGRVQNNENIVEVGFIAVPTNLMKSLETLTFNSDGSINCANALSVVAVGDGKNVVYKEYDEFTDYQVLIKNLTNKAGTFDLTKTEFTVVVYVKCNNDGVFEYTYSEAKSESWQSVYNKYTN